MDTKELIAKAKEEMEDEKQPAVTKETVLEYVERMKRDHPEEVVTSGDFSEYAMIPGFEVLNLGLAQAYMIKWKDLEALKAFNSTYFEPHVVNTQVGHHVIRGFNRLEWSELQKKIISQTKDRIQGHVSNNSDPKWADIEVEMHTEELIVCAGCVSPVYDKREVRELPAGVVTYLAKAILQSCGYEQQSMPPLPLR